MNSLKNGMHFISNHKLPVFFWISGLSLPYIIYRYVHYQAIKMDRGIEKELKKLEDKGIKLSDIPKRKY